MASPPMRTYHASLEIQTAGPRTYDVTDLITREITTCGIRSGIATVFCQHTSCSLVIMENASPDARRDLEKFLDRLVPPDPNFRHTEEGPDDMPSHVKTALTTTSETIPIKDGRLLLGTWQGVYLWEHRVAPHSRHLALVIIGE